MRAKRADLPCPSMWLRTSLPKVVLKTTQLSWEGRLLPLGLAITEKCLSFPILLKKRMKTQILLAALAAVLMQTAAFAQDGVVSFKTLEDSVIIQVDEQPIATYVTRDSNILRPYFAHVQAPGGIQVTRNHPPQSEDRSDHATMHPGIWLAFGDLNGVDFWRNKGRVEHVEFIQAPIGERNVGSFIERKHYIGPDESVVCEEEFRFAVRVDQRGHFFYFESIFRADNEFYFGDQEEMGLGIRVATPIAEVAGGQLADAAKRQGAKEIWSQSADWCDYRGEIGGRQVGMTVFCHPTNFRSSWFHARDYGLLVANPFGRAAMRKGPSSKVVVKPNETLRLRYAVWAHADVDLQTIQTAFEEYARLGRR